MSGQKGIESSAAISSQSSFTAVLLLVFCITAFAGLAALAIRVLSDVHRFQGAVSALSADGWMLTKEATIPHADQGRSLLVTTKPNFANNFGYTSFASAELNVTKITLEDTKFRLEAMNHLKTIRDLQYVRICSEDAFPAIAAARLASIPSVKAVELTGCTLSQEAVEALLSPGRIDFLSLKDCRMSLQAFQIVMTYVDTIDINAAMFPNVDLESRLDLRRGQLLLVRTTQGYQTISANH